MSLPSFALSTPFHSGKLIRQKSSHFAPVYFTSQDYCYENVLGVQFNKLDLVACGLDLLHQALQPLLSVAIVFPSQVADAFLLVFLVLVRLLKRIGLRQRCQRADCSIGTSADLDSQVLVTLFMMKVPSDQFFDEQNQSRFSVY